MEMGALLGTTNECEQDPLAEVDGFHPLSDEICERRWAHRRMAGDSPLQIATSGEWDRYHSRDVIDGP